VSSAPADRLIDRVRLRIAAADRPVDLAELARQEADLVADSAVLAELSGELAAQLTGAGPLEALLELPDVTDVLVNAPDSVWVDRGSGLRRHPVAFSSAAEVRSLAVRLAAQAGRRLDDAAPFVDAVLPDGTRLHAILPPLVSSPTVSLRVLARRRLTIADLIASHSLTPDVANLLVRCVRARMTMLISGGTGSGKTTLLAALLGEIADDERIITIEDAPELDIRHPHVVRLMARAANREGAGAVDLRELVRQALRMRGDRLVVGEFRGGEVIELLAALNTGHPGGAATVHANSAGDLPARLVALAALGNVPPGVLYAQAASAVDVVVHVSRDRSGRRGVREVALWSSVISPDQVIWTDSHGWGPASIAVAERFAAGDSEGVR
jgi:pilus assembly protein CpaF